MGRQSHEAGALILVAGMLPGCPPGGLEPVFPADVEERFVELSDCRNLIEHDLVHMRVFVDALAEGPYLNYDAPFPEGATVVKVEYEGARTRAASCFPNIRPCSGFCEGEGKDALGWHWQRVDAEHNVVEDGIFERCIRCHQGCVAPSGYLGTSPEPQGSAKG